ncbi:cell death specification protein 2 [Ceratitis capitata]|uniref:cell death specification protein 2 n=1 Tax=Ceratitis capitata TaxID=7213 RepID=UPI00032A0EC5|nr:cell death specification protein 2 [Ceratitis capitata]
MCNTSLQHNGFNNTVDPLSFSTFRLLRTCNRLMLPNADTQNYYNTPKNAGSTASDPIPSKSPLLDIIEPLSLADTADSLDVESPIDDTYDENEQNGKIHVFGLPSTMDRDISVSSSITAQPICSNPALPLTIPPLGMLPISGTALPHNKPVLPGFEYISPTNHPLGIADFPLMELNRVGVFPAFLHRRSRGEKRPIPDEQKDEKYYERRKRNNEAAKKSRDARKIREDRIAFRAALLEQENSILRAQVMALRDELQTMRRLISSGPTSAAASVIGASSRGLIAL